MVKYIKEDTQVVFSEIPDEICLAINISNCPHHCKGCHSPYLRENIGEELDVDVLDDLVKANDGITCVLFMGEGNDIDKLISLATYVLMDLNLKVALYSGSDEVNEKLVNCFHYVKLGPYIEELGPINKPTTNQRLYKYDTEFKFSNEEKNSKMGQLGFRDITYKFWEKQ